MTDTFDVQETLFDRDPAVVWEREDVAELPFDPALLRRCDVRTAWTIEGTAHAVFSRDRRYRYFLSRAWGVRWPAVAFIMLNPSTATEKVLDPTIRRCVGFAKDWGFERLIVLNLFALRATLPSELRGVEDPVGSHNDEWIRFVLQSLGVRRIVCAWGTHGTYRGRDLEVYDLLRANAPVHPVTLKLTKDGHPGHPLYIRRDVLPMTVVYPRLAREIFKSPENRQGGADDG